MKEAKAGQVWRSGEYDLVLMQTRKGNLRWCGIRHANINSRVSADPIEDGDVLLADSLEEYFQAKIRGESMTEQDHKIYNWLISQDPCAPQFDPIQKAWEAGDSLTMYQTMLGNWAWCEENQCPLDILDIEKLAGGIGKYWHENGQLKWEAHWENDQRHGVKRRWDEDGKLQWEAHWENGVRL